MAISSTLLPIITELAESVDSTFVLGAASGAGAAAATLFGIKAMVDLIKDETKHEAINQAWVNDFNTYYNKLVEWAKLNTTNELTKDLANNIIAQDTIIQNYLRTEGFSSIFSGTSEILLTPPEEFETGGTYQSLQLAVNALYNMGLITNPTIIIKTIFVSGRPTEVLALNINTGVSPKVQFGGLTGTLVIDSTTNQITGFKPEIINPVSELVNTTNENIQKHVEEQNGVLTTILTRPNAIPVFKIDDLIKGATFDKVLEKLLSQSISKVQTKTKTESKKRKKWKKRRLKKRKQKRKKQPPKNIVEIRADVSKYSDWIKTITFRFPAREPLESDRRGTMIFYLKKGGIVRKVRVNRGTFSTIVMWSFGTNLGVGYRLWSQFWKWKIVNKGKVLSWFLPRITKADRDLAIPLEIKEKRVKYK